MAAKHDIHIDQGATFKLTLSYLPVKNITGFTGRGQIKARYEDTAPLASFVVDVTDPVNGVVSITLGCRYLRCTKF